MLDPFSRNAIVALSALCVIGVVALAPLRARSSIQDAGPQPVPLIAQNTSDAVAIGSIRRDPFLAPVVRDASATSVARDGSTDPAGVAAAASVPNTTPASASQRKTFAALPSNLANDVIPAMPADTSDSVANAARITAIVTGAHAQPYAMVETGDSHEIKGVGDRIAGIAIVSIDLEGIRLQNGRRIALSGAARR